MNASQHKKLGQLKRRRNFLENRVASNRCRDLTYDKAEISALSFAIECVELLEANGLITPLVGVQTGNRQC